MTKILRTCLVALGCLTACVASAVAVGLPTFKSDLIVPNRSLAGVTLKSSYTAVVHAFRTGARGCSTTKGCGFEGADRATFSVLFARITAKSRPFVAEISIQAGERVTGGTETGVFTGPLAGLKTANGIGLGSTPAAVKRAYPHVTGNTLEGYEIKGPAEYSTFFHFLHGRVTSIAMSAAHLG